MSTAGWRGFPLSKRDSTRSALRSPVGDSVCQVKAWLGNIGVRLSTSSTVTVRPPWRTCTLNSRLRVRREPSGESQAPMPVWRALRSAGGGV